MSLPGRGRNGKPTDARPSRIPTRSNARRSLFCSSLLVSGPSDSSEGTVVDGWQLTFSADQPYQVDAFRALPTCQLAFVAPSSGDFIEPIADIRPEEKR